MQEFLHSVILGHLSDPSVLAIRHTQAPPEYPLR